jgi:hypothetical protein
MDWRQAERIGKIRKRLLLLLFCGAAKHRFRPQCPKHEQDDDDRQAVNHGVHNI